MAPRVEISISFLEVFGDSLKLRARSCGTLRPWAANHWRAAVDCHRENHPHVQHACQDLHQAAWCDVPAHDLLLASPSCQGSTHARGKDRPHHEVRSELDAHFKLKDKIEQLNGEYAHIVIDCPPALGLLTVNALVASTHLLIPIQSSYFALEGTDDLL